MTKRLRPLHLPVVSAVVAAVQVCVGCAAPRAGEKPTGMAKAADAITRQLDITRTRERNEQITETARSARTRIDQIDVHAFNAAVMEINVLIHELRERVVCVIDDFNTRLNSELDAAEIDAVSRDTRKVLNEVFAGVSALDIEAYNTAVRRLDTLVSQISERTERIDIDAANELIGEHRLLSAEMRGAIVDVRALVDSMNETVAALPVRSAAATIQQVEEAASELMPAINRLINLSIAGMVFVLLAIVLAPVLIHRRERSHSADR